MVTIRSGLPSAGASRQTTSSGLASPSTPRSSPSTPFSAPSRCLRKYSCPLPLAPSRLERQTKRLRGKFLGLSGSSQDRRSEEHTSELQSLMRTSYAVFCLKKQTERTTFLHHIH